MLPAINDWTSQVLIESMLRLPQRGIKTCNIVFLMSLRVDGFLVLSSTRYCPGFFVPIVLTGKTFESH